jgi:GNAT superfamily N-acetyltransferase
MPEAIRSSPPCDLADSGASLRSVTDAGAPTPGRAAPKEADDVRAGIEVRPAEPGDMDQLVGLCLTARAESSVGSAICSSDAATLTKQLGAFTAVPGAHVLVAYVEQTMVGMVLGRMIGPNPFTDEVSLAVEALYVDPGHRRRGAGHALMVAIAELATAAGADQVYAVPLPGARGMQRFFVQLGFAPAANHRATTTSALLRRLATGALATGRSGPRGLEDLIARRRRSRTGSGKVLPQPPVAAAGPDGVVVAEADQAGRRAGISKHVRRAVQIRRDVESSTTIS